MEWHDPRDSETTLTPPTINLEKLTAEGGIRTHAQKINSVASPHAQVSRSTNWAKSPDYNDKWQNNGKDIPMRNFSHDFIFRLK